MGFFKSHGGKWTIVKNFFFYFLWLIFSIIIIQGKLPSSFIDCLNFSKIEEEKNWQSDTETVPINIPIQWDYNFCAKQTYVISSKNRISCQISNKKVNTKKMYIK